MTFGNGTSPAGQSQRNEQVSSQTQAMDALTGRRIVYIGGFLDEAITAERGLPSHNAAGSNRMARLSQALRAGGYRPVILSPAASLRMKTHGALFHPTRLHKHKGAPALFAAVIGIFGINVLSSFVCQFLCLRKILKSNKVCGAVIYNFNPSLVMLSGYLKWVCRVPILNNVEDVSVPTLKDWHPRTEARPVQQIIFSVCMKLVARMCDAYVVPTRRFLDYLPGNTLSAVVTGCISGAGSSKGDPLGQEERLSVLYAGKVEREHGIVAFIDALRRLDAMAVSARLKVDISGTGTMADWVREQIGGLRDIEATYHGFVSSADYARLLRRAQVCVALQNPTGRYSDFKTPSKVYEFLGRGKAVIATDVGDIRDMPEGTILVIDRLDAGAIAASLQWLCADPARTAALQSAAQQHADQYFSYAAVGMVLKDLFSRVQGARL